MATPSEADQQRTSQDDYTTSHVRPQSLGMPNARVHRWRVGPAKQPTCRYTYGCNHARRLMHNSPAGATCVRQLGVSRYVPASADGGRGAIRMVFTYVLLPAETSQTSTLRAADPWPTR